MECITVLGRLKNAVQVPMDSNVPFGDFFFLHPHRVDYGRD